MLLNELFAQVVGWVKTNLLATNTAFTLRILIIYHHNISSATKLPSNCWPFVVRTMAFLTAPYTRHSLLTVAKQLLEITIHLLFYNPISFND